MPKTKFIFALLLFSAAARADFAPLIHGGFEVPAGHAIAKSTVLLTGKIQRASFTCTGIIWDQDLILTAGHCLGGGGYADLTAHFRLRKGGPGSEIKVIRQMRIRDDYPASDFDWDDLALLRLAAPIPAGYVPVRALAKDAQLAIGDDLILAGYGRSEPLPPASGDGGAGVLRAVEQKILQPVHGRTEILVDIRGKGACGGDSGGPAFRSEGDSLVLVGVASRLTENDRLPNEGREKRYGCIVDMVYTDARAHADWLIRAAEELRRPNQ